MINDCLRRFTPLKKHFINFAYLNLKIPPSPEIQSSSKFTCTYYRPVPTLSYCLTYQNHHISFFGPKTKLILAITYAVYACRHTAYVYKYIVHVGWYIALPSFNDQFSTLISLNMAFYHWANVQRYVLYWWWWALNPDCDVCHTFSTVHSTDAAWECMLYFWLACGHVHCMVSFLRPCESYPAWQKLNNLTIVYFLKDNNLL